MVFRKLRNDQNWITRLVCMDVGDACYMYNVECDVLFFADA